MDFGRKLETFFSQHFFDWAKEYSTAASKIGICDLLPLLFYLLCSELSSWVWKVLWESLCITNLDFPGLPGGSDSKESACSAGDSGSIPGSGRSPGEGLSNPLQYSCLENPMDRGAWWATVHGVTQSWTWLSNQYFLLYLLFSLDYIFLSLIIYS